MNSTFSKIFFLSVVSFIALIGLLSLEDKYHLYIFSNHPNSDVGPQIDIPLTVIVTIPFVLALFFQDICK